MQSQHQVPSSSFMVGTLMVLVAAITISSKAIIVKLAYVYTVDAETLIALRMIFSAPFFLALAVWVGLRASAQSSNVTRNDMCMIAAIGAVGGYGSMWLDFAGLEYVTAGLERIILFLYPTMVVLMSAFLFKQRIGRREVFALVTSYLGVGLVVGHDLNLIKTGTHEMALGAMLVFFSAIIYAAYFVVSGHMIKRVGSSLFTAYTMLATTFASGLHFIGSNHASVILHQPHQVYWLSLLMAVVATVLPAILMNAGIKRLGSNQSSLISSVGPVSTIFLAYLFLGEAITGLQLLGTALVLVGVMAITLKPKAVAAA